MIPLSVVIFIIGILVILLIIMLYVVFSDIMGESNQLPIPDSKSTSNSPKVKKQLNKKLIKRSKPKSFKKEITPENEKILNISLYEVDELSKI